MKSLTVRKMNKTLIGLTIVFLTIIYLLVSVAIAQENRDSQTTGINYTPDHLSWGDVYAFGQTEYTNSEYSYNNSTHPVNYQTGTGSSDTSSATLYYYYGKITFANKQAPTNGIEIKNHSFNAFQNNISTGLKTSPINSSVSIPVVTSSNNGIYTVVPGVAGANVKYHVYVYSEGGAPSDVKYALIDSYMAANDYASSEGLKSLSFSPVGNNWYVSDDISVSSLGWTAKEVGRKEISDGTEAKVGDTGTGTKEGAKLYNTVLGSTYYGNNWTAEDVYYDTLLVFQFPSTVALGPVTTSSGTYTASSNNASLGTAVIKNPFGQTVSNPYSGDHMPLIITGNPAEHCRFLRWENADGTVLSTDETFIAQFETTGNVKAVFEAIPKVTVKFAAPTTKGGGNGGTYTYNGNTMNAGSATVTINDYENIEYTLAATVTDGFRFSGWFDSDGGTLGTDTTLTTTLKELSGKTVNAQFLPESTSVQFAPVSSLFPNGYYSVAYDSSVQIIKTDSEYYKITGMFDSTATLVAYPEDDYEFLGWMDEGLQPVHYANPMTQPLAFFEQTGPIFPVFQYTKARVSFKAPEYGSYSVQVGSGIAETVDAELIKADSPTASVVLSITNVDPDYTFDGWVDQEGNILSTDSTYSTTMAELTGYTETTYSMSGITVTERSQTNNSVSPSFTWQKTTLTLAPSEYGTMQAGVTDSLTDISTQTTVTELKTASYTLSATESNANYVFVGWYDMSGNLLNSSATWTETFSTLAAYGTITPRFQSAFVTMSVKAPANGTITFDGEIISGTKEYSLDSRNTYTLIATPNDGYVFNGWLDLDGNVLSAQSTWTTTPLDNKVVTASFLATNGVAMWQVGSDTFLDLNEAIANRGSNSTIILIQNGTLPAGDYTIPSAVTVLIPFSTDYSTDYSSAPNFHTNAYTAPSDYRILTMAAGASMTVNGKLVVSGSLAAYGQNDGKNGTPSGPHGRINMNLGSSISIENGGVLAAWGYITAADSSTLSNWNNSGGIAVTVKNGGTLREAFSIRDWPGGSNASSTSVFPMNQYYIQNVEVPLQINYGGSEYVTSCVYALTSLQKLSNLQFVGSTAGMFKLSSGYFTRKYDVTTDRVVYDAYGSMTINSISFRLYVSINSTSYILPINGNMTINIHDGSTATMNSSQQVKLLPGVQINIDYGANLSIPNSVYIYDADDWVNGYTYSGVKLRQAPYVAVRSSAPVTRGSTTDAKIDINGTVTVSGKLFTSNGGANITSSEGCGSIKFSSAVTSSTTTIKENTNSAVNVTMYPAYLRNGDETVEKTAGSVKNTVYYYCATHDKWETSHEVIFHSNLTPDSTTTQTYSGGAATALNPNPWSKTGYHFSSWNTQSNGNGKNYADEQVFIFNSQEVPKEIFAQWEPDEFTVTLNPVGGTVSPTSITVQYDSTYGTLPTPERSGYRFDGWFTASNGGTRVLSTTKVAITADTTIFARWTKVYTVSFNSNGGSSIATQTVEEGETVTRPTDPVNGTMTFLGWFTDSALTEAFDFTTSVTKDITLYAKWGSGSFTVSFNTNGHGTAPENQTVNSGGKVTKPTDPSENGYAFGGWYKEAACTNAWNFNTDTVTKTTTLYAKWSPTYTVTIAWTGTNMTYTGASTGTTYTWNGETQTYGKAATTTAPGGWTNNVATVTVTNSSTAGAIKATPSWTSANGVNWASTAFYSNAECTNAYAVPNITKGSNSVIYAQVTGTPPDGYNSTAGTIKVTISAGTN